MLTGPKEEEEQQECRIDRQREEKGDRTGGRENMEMGKNV
jgi:hypothetical protein